MRILQLANKLPYPAKDGGSIATLSLSKSFARLGAEVTLMAMNTSKHYFPPEKLPAELVSTIRIISVDLDTRIDKMALLYNFIFSRKPYNAVRFVFEGFDRRLTGLLEEEQFDVIQLEGLYLAPYIETIRNHSNAIIAMRAHNVEHEIWERTLKQQPGLKRYYLRNLSRRIRRMEEEYLNRVDVMVPITERDGEKLRAMGCTRPMKVIPTGVDSPKLAPAPGNAEFPSVFHIGALDWLPNQEGLMWFVEQVWPRLVTRYPQLKLYIAGRNAPAFIKNINAPGVVFLGEVDDAYDFMDSKAIMVVPLLSGSGMRIKIIEGMALGKAIVSTTIGAEGIPVTDGGNILLADSGEEMCRAVSGIIDNRELYEELGKNAMAFVKENFDNLAIASSLVKFYQAQQG